MTFGKGTGATLEEQAEKAALDGRHAEAVTLYDAALALRPTARSFANKAVSLFRLDRLPEALKSFENAVELQPDYASGWTNRAALLGTLGRHEAAVESCDRAIRLQPDNAELWAMRASSLVALKRLEEAVVAFDEALRLQPRRSDLWLRQGNVLSDLQRFEEAAVNFDKAALDPAVAPDAIFNKGNCLRGMWRFGEALDCYHAAVRLREQFSAAWNNIGLCYMSLEQHAEAVAAFQKAVAQQPDNAGAWNNLAGLYVQAGDFGKAIECCEMLQRHRPDYPWAEGALIGFRMQLADWNGLDALCASVKAKAEQGLPVTYPFSALGWLDEPSLLKGISETYIKLNAPADPSLGPFSTRAPGGPIRIGYFSADFHEHATAWLMAGLFDQHDKSQFEVTAFSFGPDCSAPIRQRIEGSFSRFLDVRAMSDVEVARTARDMRLDIAIDLKGFTQAARTGIFALRAAPVQINYLGYPGTIGASYIDYIVADATIIPDHLREHYSEKVIRLPHSYQINDDKREIGASGISRRDCDLPGNGFVYACFNNSWKITPEQLDSWVRILRAVEGSVLWLLGGSRGFEDNLRREASSRGLNPDRLVFAPRVQLAVHLERIALADLFIDNYPCNAHTTASDALWVGLPVLTRPGASFATRVAASLLNAIDLPEMIAEDAAAYERLAIDFGKNPEKLQAIRTKLAQNRSTAPLFDTRRTTRAIEEAYRLAHQRQIDGLPPAHIDLSGMGL
ncbi:MAG: tetratricopeptide repeat protein [Rhizobiaceae bacterium]|nr:tetratricopeptide repeat protein [Rhizobiaceae bacterium]